jgi:hypothetical protein
MGYGGVLLLPFQSGKKEASLTGEGEYEDENGDEATEYK